MKRSYQYRIYPTKNQKVLIDKTFGCVRYVWNSSVAAFLSYSKENPNPVYKSSTDLRSENDFLKEVSAAALQQKQRDFIEFKKQFFSKNRKKKLRKPRFKKKGKCRDSYRLPNQKFKFLNHSIVLEKIGEVEMIVDRRPQKNCKFLSVTISKDKAGAYFASVLVDEPQSKIYPKTGEKIGIDLGLKKLATLSNGESFENPNFLRKSQAKLKHLQRIFSRKRKGSRRFIKMKHRIARCHKKITNQRSWLHHHISNSIVKRFDFIAMEKLKVGNMLKNHRLAKSISDAAWSSLVEKINYKAQWHNKEFIQVDTYYPSSKVCFECKSVNKELKLSDREWTCKCCGATLSRDYNAAKNILAQGVACALRTQSEGKTLSSTEEKALRDEVSKKSF